MARVVDALKTNQTRLGRFSRYPWKKWTDGQYWEVVPGKDFDISVQAFRVYLYTYKKMMNDGEVDTPDKGVRVWRVRTSVAPGNDSIRFRFEPDTRRKKESESNNAA